MDMQVATSSPTAPPSAPTVLVVILNWNGLAHTLECLRSVRELAYPNLQVLVIDNGSRAEDAETLVREVGAECLIRNPTNLGFAGGVNIGLREVLARKADYAWLLNNDVVIPTDCLARLVRAAEGDERLGLASPVILDYTSTLAVQSVGTIIDVQRELRVPLRSLTDPRGDTWSGRLALWGTALLIKREVIERVGLMDERYFAYGEDIDYSVRTLAAGFTTLVVRNAAVYHKDGQALGGAVSPIREYLTTRNLFLFWTSHLRGWRRLTYPFRYLSWVLDRVVMAQQQDQGAMAEHMLSGAWDALRGHWGSWDGRGRLPRPLERIVRSCILNWHPYMWIRLLAGDIRGVAAEVRRRVLSRRGPLT
jgi:GT2 family glycosyltransferase